MKVEEPDAFKTLLACLDQDDERAGEKYELLRAKLIKFFELKGAPPEDLADQCLDRLAEKCVTETVRNTAAFALGIARNVLLEFSRLESRARALDPELATSGSTQIEANGGDAIETRRLECLERCLQKLSVQDRELVLQFFNASEKRAEARRRLAEAARLSIGALRVRVCRARERLEKCCRACVDLGEAETVTPGPGLNGREYAQ